MFELFVMDDFIRMLMAVLVGGLIGAEREFRDKSAGFRTMIFICFGATLFTLFSMKIGGAGDPSRIAANIVSGVGFLGAGAIFRDTGKISGLTTAATIWLAAAIGMGIGAGYLTMSMVGAAIIIVVLVIFPRIERMIDHVRDVRTYQVTIENNPEAVLEVEKLITSHGLRIDNRKRRKSGGDMICIWRVHGKPHQHDKFIDALLVAEHIKEFDL